jgi:hypothetical protein
MEHYQWSLTWWLFRFVTLGEVIAIIYLFWSTWQLSKCMHETHQMMSELLKTKKACEGHQDAMTEVDVKFDDLHQEFKRKEYAND